ncbi:MAG: chemotaxis response regulator protein-glutamate methylesterase [Bacteroidales bacterium]|nr:MAG: chemotaxis response regulator protein-glutamate methylesterase [Bacteroidales bacterium]
MNNKIRVLVVDDSAVVRQTLAHILDSDRNIKVIGTATDPYFAVKKMSREKPDVITLDIEMPRMDGLTFLKRIMTQHPIPCVIISSLTTKGTETTLKALEYGAVEIITKPIMYLNELKEECRIKIIDAVKAASCAKINRIEKQSSGSTVEKIKIAPKFSANVIIPDNALNKSMIKTTEKVVVIGASTGGTEAIKRMLTELPPDCPGIVIVQHMPEQFTRSFAKGLNEQCSITVKEAQNNDTVLRGQALIAPGNYHTLLKRSGARYYIKIKDGPLVNRHRPSVDVLFRATAQYAGKNAVGILLTGMGNDGAQGLLEMRQNGAYTIAQDEKSCIVFGMPHEAIKIGAADKILPLEEISEYIMRKGK